jgi:hypothetical protein
MKINYGVLFAGAAIGGVIGWYYMMKVQVPNAYAIGQANPTLPYQNLTAAQKSQLNQSPGLPSPPPMSTVVANAISGIGTTGDQSQSVGQQAGTGALLGRRRLLPVHYRGMGRHG